MLFVIHSIDKGSHRASSDSMWALASQRDESRRQGSFHVNLGDELPGYCSRKVSGTVSGLGIQ